MNEKVDNYKLAVKRDATTYFDADTVMPFKQTDFELRIMLDPQHDGHLWRQTDIELAEYELVEEIMSKLRQVVMESIRISQPFKIHG